MELLFWLSAFIIFWTYFGYFIFLAVVSVLYEQTVLRDDITPGVTLIITAFNEELRIGDKLKNSLALDYPNDKLTVVVVSDGSTDKTDDIVRSFSSSGIVLLRIEGRRGKHFCQGEAIRQARTEIIVLSDATTFLEKEAIRAIVRPFADPSVGVVSGTDRTPDDSESASGEGAYVAYEMKLRELEAKAGSIIGASGCFFAIRRNLVDDWIDNMSSDFYMPIIAKIHGYRSVPEPDAIGVYTVLPDPGREFQRKVRTVLHGIEVLLEFARIMDFSKYGFFSIQIISHKLMRWLVPFCLLGMLFANMTLTSDSAFYSATMAAQLLLYACATIGALFPQLQRILPIRIPLFFVMVNLSIVVAWYRYLLGEKQVVWDVTKR